MTLVISSFGGWFAGTLADRFGRVRVLQVTILWYSIFTFLCAFAQNFEQLFILRGLHGLGFGGEWAAGAVLMGEVIRDKYRGRGVGFVQTGGRSAGPGGARLCRALRVLPEAIAWRALFAVGMLPALLRAVDPPHIPTSPKPFEATGDSGRAGIAHLFSAFRGPHLWTDDQGVADGHGRAGRRLCLNFWMPTYLRTVRHCRRPAPAALSRSRSFGALIGFLLGAYLADRSAANGPS